MFNKSNTQKLALLFYKSNNIFLFIIFDMDEVAQQLYKEFGFAFVCTANNTTKDAKMINRELNNFVANHKAECGPIIRENRNDKFAIIMGIDKLVKELEPDIYDLIRDVNHPPKSEDDIMLCKFNICQKFCQRHEEYDKRFCGIYSDEAMDEIFAALPELEPGLMKRYTYLMQKVDELKQK